MNECPYAFIVDSENIGAIQHLIDDKRLPQALNIQPAEDRYEELNMSVSLLHPMKYIVIVDKEFMDRCAKLLTFWHGRSDVTYKFDHTHKDFIIDQKNQIDEHKSICWFMTTFFEHYWCGGHMK